MTQRIGIDFVDDGMRVATVETNDAGQLTAEAKLHKDWPELGADTVNSAAVTVGVPDNLCQVKQLRLSAPSESDLRLRVEFELSQTQLEPPESFRYDYISTDQNNRLLGLIYRRTSLTEWLSASPFRESRSGDSIRYCGRAAALGYGYLQYCHPVAGNLVCLTDFSQSVVPICFVHDRQIVDLARQQTVPADPTDEIASRRQATDFKTIVNFRLMVLADAGINVPLSQLVAVGVSEQLRTCLLEYFPVGVSRPELLPAVTVSGDIEDPAACLVSLGLTVY